MCHLKFGTDLSGLGNIEVLMLRGCGLNGTLPNEGQKIHQYKAKLLILTVIHGFILIAFNCALVFLMH